MRLYCDSLDEEDEGIKHNARLGGPCAHPLSRQKVKSSSDSHDPSHGACCWTEGSVDSCRRPDPEGPVKRGRSAREGALFYARSLSTHCKQRTSSSVAVAASETGGAAASVVLLLSADSDVVAMRLFYSLFRPKNRPVLFLVATARRPGKKGIQVRLRFNSLRAGCWSTPDVRPRSEFALKKNALKRRSFAFSIAMLPLDHKASRICTWNLSIQSRARATDASSRRSGIVSHTHVARPPVVVG